MNLYEHTIVARQDISPSQIKQITEKYSKIVEKNDGDIVQSQNWGLLNLSYIIKKNKSLGPYLTPNLYKLFYFIRRKLLAPCTTKHLSDK